MKKTYIIASILTGSMFTSALAMDGMGNDHSMMMTTTMTTHQSTPSVSTVRARTMANAGGMRMMAQDLVTNASKVKNLTTLVAAVQAASLVDTLKGTGPFTVFAPTNRAFGNLPQGTVDSLLKPENKKQLTDILTYHVVPGSYTSDEIKDGMTLTTVLGTKLAFSIKNGQVFINGKSTVVTPDIITSNGVIHVIGGVLLPTDAPQAQAVSATKNIVDTAVSVPSLSTLVTAVTTAGLVDTLKGVGPFTVFAPDNAAFAKLPAGTVENLLKPESKSTLTGILTYHVVPGTYKASDLTNGQTLTTVQGKKLTVSIANGKVMINGSTVTTADVTTSNGVVHVIDSVLLP